VPAVAAAVSSTIKSDMTPFDLIAIGAAMVRDPGDPDRLVIDTTLVNPIIGQDGAYLLEAKPDLKPAVARFVGGSSTASVEVLNGAGVAGLANRTAERLTQRGFVVTNVGDAPRAQAQSAILARPGVRSAAEQVANTLGIPTARVSESPNAGPADIQVILGPDVR